MDGYLRQSTASQSRLIGPFVDDADFKTAETGLTIANTDIKLRANGTTLANKNSGGGTHQANGMYSVTWDATDTANVGELKYSVVVSGALQVFGSYVVLEEVVYDALMAASALGYVADQPVNTTKVGGTTQTAKDLGAINVTNLNTLSGHDPGETIMGATDLGTGSGFTGIPWNAAWDAEVQSEADDAIKAFFGATWAAAIATLMGTTISTGFSLLQSMRLLLAAFGGKTSGAGTATITLRNAIDTLDAVVIGMTGSDRTSFTFDLSA